MTEFGMAESVSFAGRCFLTGLVGAVGAVAVMLVGISDEDEPKKFTFAFAIAFAAGWLASFVWRNTV